MKFMSGDLFGGSERCCDHLRRQRAAATMRRPWAPAGPTPGRTGRRADGPRRERITDPSQHTTRTQTPIFIRYKGSSSDQREEFIETVYPRKEISDVGFFSIFHF